MEAPLALLKFITKASLNAVGGGVTGDFVVEVLPGIAKDVWNWWGKDKSEAQRRAAIQELAALPPTAVRKAVDQAVAEAAADRPADVRARLSTFVSLVPEAIHLSLCRPVDPRGLTVPSHLPLQRAEDLLAFLPQRMPRFSPGARPLPGVDRELVKLLGVGGFGEVWRARNPHFPGMPDVALKFCLDPTARELLLKHEAALLARVMGQGMHPGIVPLRQTYLSAEPPCLEYEFVDGSDLAGAVLGHQASKGALPADTATRIVVRLARAVGHAHRLSPPIVHRDLKPANVLVRKKDGKSDFLITDFGIGGVVASQALQQTRQGHSSQPLLTSLKGAHTPLYASPEQKRGEPPDPRDDVHALGVIWYQLLIGDFSEGAPAGSAWKTKLRQRGVPDALLDLLESCFEAKAQDRPSDAATLAAKIEALPRTAPGAGQAVGQPVPTNSGQVPVETKSPATMTTPGAGTVAPQTRTTEPAPSSGAIRPAVSQQPTGPVDAPRDLLAEATAALGRGDYSGAIATSTQALKASPPPLEAYRFRARAYTAKNKLDRAIKDLSAVVAHAGATGADFVERGRALLRKGKPNKAVIDFTEAVARDRGSHAAYLARAEAYLVSGSRELAFADFAAALRLAPQDAGVLTCRGEAHLSGGAPEQALADFNEAVRCEPGNPQGYIGRGRVYLALGQAEKALSELIQATHADPKCAEAYLERGIIHAHLGQGAQAIEDLSHATRLAWGLARAYPHRARAYARLGQYARAEEDFGRAIRNTPNDAMLYVERGDVRASRGHQEGALKDYVQAIKIDQNLARAHFRRGALYLRTRQFGRAAGSFTRALELAPDETEALALRGLAHARKGQPDEALADAEECFRRNQCLALAHDIRGLVLAGKKQFSEALIDFSEAIRLGPTEADFYADRGLAHHGRGDYDLAIADFKEAIKLGPKEAAHFLNRARAYEKKGDRDRAQADRERARSLAATQAKEPKPRGQKKPAGESKSQKGHDGPDASVSLGDIITASILVPPLRLFRRYKGRELTATLLADGAVEFGGTNYPSCSTAAEHARASVTGKRMNTNGWGFWQFLAEDGKPQTLAEARQRFVRMKAGASPNAPVIN